MASDAWGAVHGRRSGMDHRALIAAGFEPLRVHMATAAQ